MAHARRADFDVTALHTALDDDAAGTPEQLQLAQVRAERHRRAADQCRHPRPHAEDHHRRVVGVDREGRAVGTSSLGNRAPDVGAGRIGIAEHVAHEVDVV